MAKDAGPSTPGRAQEPVDLSGDADLERIARVPRVHVEPGAEIARGGMGRILHLRDDLLGRDLAMKILHGDEGVVEATPGGDATLVPSPSLLRFLREARATAQLPHPGIVPVHSLGVDQRGRLFFTMKLVRGRTLAEVFRLVRGSSDGWTLTKALQVFVRICETLAFAHDRGVLHRDLKPPNVMVGDFGEVYVMDWGLARSVHEAADDGPPSPEAPTEDAGDDVPLTQHGTVLGTPHYMAPEQAEGDLDRVDARTDVYAVGAMMYELLAGFPPYREGDEASPHPLVVADRVRSGPPAPLAEIAPRAPPELAAVVARAMARGASDRYPSAAELAEDLHRFLDGRVVRAHGGGPLVELRSWIRRHRVEAAAASTIALLLVASSSIIAVRERRNADLLETQRDAAVAAERDERHSRERAESESRRAEGNLLSARALTEVGRDPALALQLAIEGATRAPGPAASEALYLALSRCAEMRRCWGHDAYVMDVRWDPAGTRLLSRQMGTLAIVWDAATGRALHRLDEHEAEITSATWSPRGDRILTTAMDGRPRIWDAASGRALHVLEGHEGGVGRAAFDATGTRIATAGDDGTARVWDAATGAPLAVLRGHDGPVWSVEFHPSGARLLTAGPDLTARVFDVASGTEVLRVATSDGPRHRRRAFPSWLNRSRAWADAAFHAADGDVIVTWRSAREYGTNGGEVRAYDAADGRPIGATDPSARLVRFPALLGDGGTILLSEDKEEKAPGTVRDARTFAVVRTVTDVHGGGFLATSRDGAWMAGADTRLPVVHVAGTDGTGAGFEFRHDYAATAADVSPDGTRLATAACDRTVRVWRLRGPDVRRGVEGRRGDRLLPSGRTAVRPLEEDEAGCTGLECVDTSDGRVLWRREGVGRALHPGVAPGGRFLWAAGPAGITILDAATGATVRRGGGPEWEADHGRINMDVDPTGRFAALRRGEGLAIFDIDAARFLHRPGLAAGMSPFSWSWSADGALLVICNPPLQAASLWEVATGREILRVRGHSGYVVAAALAPDATRFATAAVDRSVRIWDARDGSPLAADTAVPMGENALRWSPDGALLAVVTEDEGILFLDGRTAARVSRLPTECHGRGPAWFDPAGGGFFTRDRLGPLLRWPLEPLRVARERCPGAMEPRLWREHGTGDATASDAYEEEWLLAHPDPILRLRRAEALAEEGDRPGARRWIEAALEVRRRLPVAHHALARWHVRAAEAAPAGAADRAARVAAALDALEECARLEPGSAGQFAADPLLAPLADEPRFRALAEAAPR